MNDDSARLRISAAAGWVVAAASVMAIAAFLFLRRSGSSELLDQRVAAADVAALRSGAVTPVVEVGSAAGVRLNDPTLAGRLGLAPGDVVTQVMGVPVREPSELELSILRASSRSMKVTTLYIEIMRDHRPRLVRWRVDGDLANAPP